MKITEDILNAMQSAIDVIGSQSEFAKRANIHSNTLTNYLTRQTQTIKEETLDKLYPLIAPFLSEDSEALKRRSVDSKFSTGEFDFVELTSDEKILLEAFNELPKSMREDKLIEICSLATQEVKKRKKH
ncbi:hypothetical protein AAEX28_13775 [Lentisphaerota bacterium WC36G]|nr:hypothetical protein LJT99_00525 [Lentisphaerae bacterium WC36]